MGRRLIYDDFLRWLHRQAATYPSRHAFASHLRLSPGYVSDVLNGHRPPSRKFLEAVKVREVRLFEVDAA